MTSWVGLARWAELALIAGAAGLVGVVLCAYLRALVRVRAAGLTWLGLKVMHVVLVAIAYELGAAFILLETLQRYSLHAPLTYRVPLGMAYGAVGIASQVLILMYVQRGGSVGAYAFDKEGTR